MAVHSAARRVTSPALRVASDDAVSVSEKLPFWIWVSQARTAGSELTLVGSGQAPATGIVETIFTRPVLRTTPVSGLPVKSVLTDRVRRPSGVSRQLQHSVSSCSGSKTNKLAQTLPAAVPG